MADYDIFRQQLLQAFPAYGHALWDPNPTRPDKPVEVGDVGFMRWGKFHRLFNALLSADHPSHELGVPEYHVPLVPNLTNHINAGSLSCGHYCSGEVNIEPEPETRASPDDLSHVSYMCARRRQGASSFFPVNVRRENTLAMGDFGEWILKHIDSWFAFARRLGLGIEQMEDIILVTGCDRTKSWTNVTFLGSNVDARVSFGVNAVDGPNAGVRFQFSPENVRGAVLNRGPEGTNLPENQCVFIRGFRVARTLKILPRHLKAAAGPSPDPEGYDYEPGMELVSIPADTKYRDPLHQLLDHIAERTPECDMVLVHDDDLERININGIGEGTTLQPDMSMDIFRRSDIEVHEVDCDLPPSTSSPNTDAHAVRVAMLSAMYKNWKIAKGTAFQSQASSLATQNIGMRNSSKSLASLTSTSPDNLNSLGPIDRGDISISPPSHGYSEPWDDGPLNDGPCFTPQVPTIHSNCEVDCGGTYLPVPIQPRREIRMGQGTSIQRPPVPVGPECRLGCLQSHSTQSTNVPHHLGSNFVHQQNWETVIGTRSRLGSYRVREDESPNAPGFPPAIFLEPNVPYYPQGDVSSLAACSNVLVSPSVRAPSPSCSILSPRPQVRSPITSPRLQLGIGHVTSLQQPPMGRSYPPAFRQMVPHRPPHAVFSHLQNPGPMTATSSHYQGLTGVQHKLEGAGHRGAYSGVPVSPRLQPGVGVSVNHLSRPLTPRSTCPTAYQPYPVQPAYVARSPHPSDIPHQQNLVAMIATSSQSPHMPQSPHPTAYQPHPVQPTYVIGSPHPPDVPHQRNPVAAIATSSQYQGSAFAQDALRRPYYQQWTSNYTAFSSPASTALQLPVQPQRSNLTDEHHLPLQMPDAPHYLRGTSKRRALIIAINYTSHLNPAYQLQDCVENGHAIANFLYNNLGFAREDTRIMTDESSSLYPPTKENILREMAALVHDAQPHDSFFIYFSGHAVQIKDLDGDESDGLDECICAMDYLGDDPHPNPNTLGLIVDDIMHDIMVRPLPAGCRLTAIFDSCNSGTLLDLPYLYNARGVVKEFRHPNRLEILRQKSSYADVVSLGATKDSRMAFATNRGGALRRAFIECLTAFRNELTYKQLIRYLREDIISRGIPQQPLLSSSHEIDTDLPFII